MKRIALFLTLFAFPSVAWAQSAEFCTQRPGQTTSACTLPKGETVLELGLLDLQTQRSNGAKETGIVVGDAVARHGLTERLELQIGWTPFSYVRNEAALGMSSKSSGIGDATIGLQHNILDGNSAIALNAVVTLPIGSKSVSAGDWGVAMQVPFSFDLGRDIGFDITPQIEAAVDGDGNGRHLAFGGAIGFGLPLADAVELGLDLSMMRDRDPAGSSTNLLAGASIAMRAGESWQFDLGGAVGLSQDSPDIVFGLGLARRF